MEPGVRIEFLSGEGWKPGVIANMAWAFDAYEYRCRLSGHGKVNVRIRTGKGVYVIRPRNKIRQVRKQ